MNKTDINNIRQLFSQVQTIIKSYDRINKANGSYFNIFSILKVESDEVRTHSRFIAELIDPKGKHGFKDEFLKAFISELGINYQINTKDCEVKVEKSLGRINKDFTKGGNIDILVQEKNNRNKAILIENKIYALEQKNQLLRYQNGFPRGKVIYLTLNGDKSNMPSSKEISYEIISYKNDIINWLEECKKIAVDNPIIRETIKQYINLLKKLTNQNINKVMNEELAKLIIKNEANFNSFIELNNAVDSIKKEILTNKILPILFELKEEFEKKDNTAELIFDKENLLNPSLSFNSLFKYTNEKLREFNLEINFQFQQKNHNNLIGGFVKTDKKENYNLQIHKKMIELFNKEHGIPVRNNDSWLSFFDYWYFMNWTKNFLDLKNLTFGNFKEDLKYKLTKMLEIVNNN